jgi:hypothetical protein
MADTYTDDLRIRLQEDGANSTTWGQITNTNLQLIEDSVSGLVSIATTGGTTTLTTVSGGTDQARMAILKITGALVSNVTIEVPAKTKKYLVWNATTNAYTVTVKTSAGTGILITQNLAQELFCDATNVYPSGVATPLDSITSGVTGTGSMVRATSPTLVTPVLGVATATSLNGLTVSSSTGTFTLTNAKTLAVTHSLTLAGTDSTTMTFPAASDTLAGLGTLQTFTKSQRGTITTDNDGSFDMNVTNNFKCTTAGALALTFTNITAGQSGNIIFINASNHAITAAATTKVPSTLLAAISVTGTYLLGYFSDGTNVYVAGSAALA